MELRKLTIGVGLFMAMGCFLQSALANPCFLQNEALAAGDGKSFGFNGARVLRVVDLGKKLAEFHRKVLGMSNEDGQQVIGLLQDEFHKITLPFMDDMEGFRALVLDLIKESCKLRGRTHSYLLTWGSCPEGKELESIKSHLKTLPDFCQFNVDLINFLSDLIFSCQKGYAQFREIIQNGQDK